MGYGNFIHFTGTEDLVKDQVQYRKKRALESCHEPISDSTTVGCVEQVFGLRAKSDANVAETSRLEFDNEQNDQLRVE